MPSTVVVVAGLISRGGAPPFLLSRRLPDAHLAGYWEFPGGKLEPNEDPVSALQRELREELGIGVDVGHVYAVGHHVYESKTVLLIVYEVTLVSGEPSCREVAEYQWFEPDELVQLELPPADDPILDRIREDYGLA